MMTMASPAFSKSVRKRASLARSAASARLCSVMSRETARMPMTFPSASRYGDLVEVNRRGLF